MLREKEMFDNAYIFLEKHWNDNDFGQKEEKVESKNPKDYYKEGSIMYEYYELQAKYKGSKLWQTLLLDVLDHLERKMEFERRKANGQ